MLELRENLIKFIPVYVFTMFYQNTLVPLHSHFTLCNCTQFSIFLISCVCFNRSLSFLTKLERLDLGCNELEDLVSEIKLF